MNSKKAVFILPYFGKFPNYFQLYLQSCKYNIDFVWLIITDDLTSYNYPDNVIVVIKTFEDIKVLIQSKFDFKISLDNPYKLCDYRPAFGYIFQDYIVGYDFWGYVDPDCIWGDLNKYVTRDILNKFDKLFVLGHLALYRNTQENNTMFMRLLNGSERFREVFCSCENEQFDEAINNRSINDIYSCHNIPVYEDKGRADVHPGSYSIRLTDYNSPNKKQRIESYKFQYFEWKKGILYNVSFSFLCMKKRYREHSYLHFHGERKMKCDENISPDHFYVIKDRFLNGDYENRRMFVFMMYLHYLSGVLRDLRVKSGRRIYSFFGKDTPISLFR